LFDSGQRGWVWTLLVMLLVVFGTRLSGVLAAVALLLAQAAISMMWWWLYRPQGEKERNLSGLWLMFGVVVFALLVLFDIFTYEYAFVSDFAPELDFLNPTVPALLRGFRGLGLAVILLGVFLAVMPMVGTQRRIAWVGGKWQMSVFFIAVIAGTSAYAAFEARPPVVQGRVDPDVIRVGTYNINGGYNEFYYFDLSLMATTISFSGADIVLLQEIEKGRLTSFGVDQALWLSRNLGMDARFFATNEGLQGLAVLSRFEIAFDDGVLLDSRGNQTGVQRVQIVPDGNVITLYNTWLEPLLDTGSGGTIEDLEAAQVAQLNDLLATIARQFPNGRLGRMIIGGTFNNVPDSDVIARIRGLGFQDPFEDQQPEVVATFARTGVRARLDYLWTTVANNFQIVESIVVTPPPPDFIPRQASDHLLALIAIALR
jgi:endonuclease/exonuclease/phosphatase family metal-dependent hydrolase